MEVRKETDDLELVSRIRAGDERAFRFVFELYSPKLYNFSFRLLKSKEQCEEVVQEVFIKFWLHREKLDLQYPIAPLLYTITRRLTLNALRNIASSQSARDKLWLNLKTVGNETEQVILLNDLEQFTEQVLAQLPKQQQLVFRMSRHQELTYDEISEELNISRNTVKNHLVAALKILRRQLQKSFFV